MKQLLCLMILAHVTFTVTADRDRIFRPRNRYGNLNSNSYEVDSDSIHKPGGRSNLFISRNGNFVEADRRERIFRSKTRCLRDYRVAARRIFNDMEDIIGDATHESDLAADDLDRYKDLYRSLWATIIRDHFQRRSEAWDPETREEAQQLRDEMTDFLESYSSDRELDVENYFHELALLVRKMHFDEEVGNLNSADQERATNVFEEIVSLADDREICELSRDDRRTLLSLIQTLASIFEEEPPEYPTCESYGGMTYNESENPGGIVGLLLGPIWHSSEELTLSEEENDECL